MMKAQRLHARSFGRQANIPLQLLAGLLVLAMASGRCLAVDRALRLHATSHAPASSRLAASESRHPANHGRVSEVESRTPSSRSAPSRSGKSAEKHAKATAPAGKGRGKSSQRKRREEPVDPPVTLHRVNSRERRAAYSSKYMATNREPRYVERSDRVEAPAPRAAEVLPLHNPKIHHQVGNAAGASGEQAYDGGEPSQQSEKMTSKVDAALRRPKAYASGQARPEDDGAVLIGDAITTATPYRGSNTPAPVRALPENEAIVSAVPAAGLPMQPKVVTGFGAEMAPSQASAIHVAQPAMANRLAPATANGAAVRELADNAVQPMVLPVYTRSGELMMPAPLKGSHEILVHQNVMADHDGLERIRNDRELNKLRAQHMLVEFPYTAGLRVNESLPENRRIARPWTVKFATDAARAFYAQFGEPIVVSSAVRTVSYQLRLERVNGNAAAVSGEGASPHLTGQAIDLAKRSMTSEEIAWMRTYLAPFIDAGKIDVEEEFQQACFHISVYRAYMPVIKHAVAPRTQVAQLRGEMRVVRDDQ